MLNMVEVLKMCSCVCREPTGVKDGDLFMHYKSVFQDVREAVDWVHIIVSTAIDLIQFD